MPGIEEATSGYELSLIFYIPGALLFLILGSSILWATWDIKAWAITMGFIGVWGIPSLIVIPQIIKMMITDGW